MYHLLRSLGSKVADQAIIVIAAGESCYSSCHYRRAFGSFLYQVLENKEADSCGNPRRFEPGLLCILRLLEVGRLMRQWACNQLTIRASNRSHTKGSFRRSCCTDGKVSSVKFPVFSATATKAACVGMGAMYCHGCSFWKLDCSPFCIDPKLKHHEHDGCKP